MIFWCKILWNGLLDIIIVQTSTNGTKGTMAEFYFRAQNVENEN